MFTLVKQYHERLEWFTKWGLGRLRLGLTLAARNFMSRRYLVALCTLSHQFATVSKMVFREIQALVFKEIGHSVDVFSPENFIDIGTNVVREIANVFTKMSSYFQLYNQYAFLHALAKADLQYLVSGVKQTFQIV